MCSQGNNHPTQGRQPLQSFLAMTRARRSIFAFCGTTPYAGIKYNYICFSNVNTISLVTHRVALISHAQIHLHYSSIWYSNPLSMVLQPTSLWYSNPPLYITPTPLYMVLQPPSEKKKERPPNRLFTKFPGTSQRCVRCCARQDGVRCGHCCPQRTRSPASARCNPILW